MYVTRFIIRLYIWNDATGNKEVIRYNKVQQGNSRLYVKTYVNTLILENLVERWPILCVLRVQF
jgi:hypothetical protein